MNNEQEEPVISLTYGTFEEEFSCLSLLFLKCIPVFQNFSDSEVAVMPHLIIFHEKFSNFDKTFVKCLSSRFSFLKDPAVWSLYGD